MITAVQRHENTEEAVLELSLFFVRHSLPYWPAQLAPVVQALRAFEGGRALDAWGRLPLMGEHGLMQLRLTYDAGYRVADLDAEQRHFERLLQQALDAMNNLRLFLKSGVSRPLLDIYRDSPI